MNVDSVNVCDCSFVYPHFRQTLNFVKNNSVSSYSCKGKEHKSCDKGHNIPAIVHILESLKWSNRHDVPSNVACEIMQMMQRRDSRTRAWLSRYQLAQSFARSLELDLSRCEGKIHTRLRLTDRHDSSGCIVAVYQEHFATRYEERTRERATLSNRGDAIEQPSRGDYMQFASRISSFMKSCTHISHTEDVSLPLLDCWLLGWVGMPTTSRILSTYRYFHLDVPR